MCGLVLSVGNAFGMAGVCPMVCTTVELVVREAVGFPVSAVLGTEWSRLCVRWRGACIQWSVVGCEVMLPFSRGLMSQVEATFFSGLMDHFDTDQNGVLDRTEWMAMLATVDDSGVETAEDWSAMFDRIDVGEDGKIRT